MVGQEAEQRTKKISPAALKLGWYLWRIKWNARYGNRSRQISDASRQMAEIIRGLTYEDDESITIEGFIESLDPSFSSLRGWNPHNLITPRYYSILYSLVRKLKPATSIETGVMFGCSSYAVLSAIEANGGPGRLISIDVSSKPFGYTLGFAVPAALRPRWNLVIADSKKYLPACLEEAGFIDLFISDGDHSYDTMVFEMEAAWPHLRKGGLLVVDDCNLNNALRDFAKHQSSTPFYLSRDGMYADSMAILVR